MLTFNMSALSIADATIEDLVQKTWAAFGVRPAVGLRRDP